MSYFAVTREAGPAWIDGIGAFEQPDVEAHAAFMGQLADEGFVLFAGPLAGSEASRIRVLLVVDADNEAEVSERLASDPWASTGRLRVSTIESWNVIVGAGRLAAHPAAR